jgi:trimethylamine--corrinoid protein Co-methyltransferase
MKLHYELLSDREIDQIHEASLEILATTGMRFESSRLQQGLAKAGASVDSASGVARIPKPLVERTLENSRRLLAAGKKLHLLNGVTSEVVGGREIAAKISGGCELFLDWDAQQLREATAEELLSYIRLGELLPEVDFVGNPIVLRRDLEGQAIEERMRRIKTAALVAKNTRKVGSMEVWSEKEIDLFVEMGAIVRGGRQAYEERPCLLTAKETISPLFLDAAAGNILLAFAERDLPCTIIPMPITGLSTPVTMLGNAMVGNAEILGVITAIQSVCEEALVGGGTISGVLDMQTGCASFSAPEAILQDIAVAEVHARRYGLNYLIGSGYTDAKYPNSQTLAEKALKFFFTYLSGRYSYPLGLINSGSVFSAEQALVDLEICRDIHGHFRTFGGFEEIDQLLELVQDVGVRGNFMEAEHTFLNFRRNWLPQIYDRKAFDTLEKSRALDVYRNAHERYRRLMSAGEFWQIEAEKAREIDRIVETAERSL